MSDEYGNILDPVLKSKKRLADFEIDADKRPSTCEIRTLPRDGQSFDTHMRVATLGAVKVTQEADEATGRLFPVGIAISSHEYPQE